MGGPTEPPMYYSNIQTSGQNLALQFYEITNYSIFYIYGPFLRVKFMDLLQWLWQIMAFREVTKASANYFLSMNLPLSFFQLK